MRAAPFWGNEPNPTTGPFALSAGGRGRGSGGRNDMHDLVAAALERPQERREHGGGLPLGVVEQHNSATTIEIIGVFSITRGYPRLYPTAPSACPPTPLAPARNNAPAGRAGR